MNALLTLTVTPEDEAKSVGVAAVIEEACALYRDLRRNLSANMPCELRFSNGITLVLSDNPSPIENVEIYYRRFTQNLNVRECRHGRLDGQCSICK